MLVILDVVTNHMGQLFYYDINGNGQPDDTISRRRLRRTRCLQICAQHPEQCTPDELTYCAAGRRATSSRSSSGIPTTTIAACRAGPRSASPAPRRSVSPTGPTRTAPRRRGRPTGSAGPTTSRGSTIRAGTTARAASTCGGTRPDYSTDFVREQETTGDFPGGLKDLDTDNPDVKEALIRVVRSTGSRSPTSTASASTPSSTSIVPRSIATCAASGATSPIAMRAEGRSRSASRTSSSSARASTATTR